MSILFIDDEILINGHLVLRINYNTNINKVPINNILCNLNSTLSIADKSANKGTYILLLDFKKVKKRYINIKKIKTILHFLQNTYPDKLEKCVVYNYTAMWKIILNLITNLLDPVTKQKIVLKKNISNIIDQSNFSGS